MSSWSRNIAHPIRAFRLRIGEDLSEQEAPIAEAMLLHPICLPVCRFPNCPRITRLRWSSRFGTVSRTAALPSSNPISSNIRRGTFASLARTRRDAATLSPAEAVTAAPPDAAAEALDLAFWDSVKDNNRREELAAYLEQHPNGHFAPLARARLSSPEVG